MKNKLFFFFCVLFFILAISSCIQIIETVYKGTYTITFNANGGNGSMQVQSVLQDKSITLKKNAF